MNNPADHARMCLLRALNKEAGIQWFRARLGRRRSFLSQQDADSYDAGFGDASKYDCNLARMDLGGPYSTGWHDFESEECARQDDVWEVRE